MLILKVVKSHFKGHLSRDARKPVFGVSLVTGSDTNRPIQSQKQGRSLKFRIYEDEKFTIRVAKTKALISFAVSAKLICAFVFA